MKKLLSIIVPSYNMEVLLPRCINSMVNPLVEESLEIIVVNDGSKDNTLEVALDFKKEYPSIVQVIDKVNGNYGSAINSGLQYSTGKYVRILDADDMFDNASLNKFLILLSTCTADLVCTNFSVEECGYQAVQRPTNVKFNTLYNFKEFDLEKYDLPNFCMHGLTYRKDILQECQLKLQEGISYTDVEYCYYPIPFVNTIVFFDLILYKYQLGRIGQTVNVASLIRSTHSMLRVINRMLEDLERNYDITSQIFRNKMLVASSPIALFYSTALCYDNQDISLENVNIIENRLLKLPELYDLLSKRDLYGVRYVKRYRNNKSSNSFFFRLYYKCSLLLRRCIKFLLGCFF